MGLDVYFHKVRRQFDGDPSNPKDFSKFCEEVDKDAQKKLERFIDRELKPLEAAGEDGKDEDYRLRDYTRLYFAFVEKLRKIIAEYILRPLLGVRSARKILANSHEHIYSNSFYVDKMIRDFYGPVNSTVFYPPTIFDFNSQDIVRDPLRVVCLGRIDPEKRIEDIIEIVLLARNLSQMNLKLYIGGGAQPNCQGYMSMLKEITSKYDWIVWQGEVYGKEKEAFLLSGTFAVHTRRDEEFGISITEYLKAGLVAIVPNEGGACEIVNSPALSFDTNAKAAMILARLLSDTDFFKNQRCHCTELATYFTRDEYLKRQKNLLSNIINTNE